MRHGAFGWLVVRALPGGALRLAHPSPWGLQARFALLPGHSPLPHDQVVYRQRPRGPLGLAERGWCAAPVLVDRVSAVTGDGMLIGPTTARLLALRATYETAGAPRLMRRARAAADRYGIAFYEPADPLPDPAALTAASGGAAAARAAASACPPDALIGVRGFRLLGPGLGAMSCDSAWLPGDNEAVCAGSPVCEQPAASDDCHCGMNAFHGLRALDAYAHMPGFRPDVIAAVAGWGTVSVHRDGWRSQYGRVLAVASDRGGADPALRLSTARAYGVPAVLGAGLAAVASEYGAPVTGRQLPGA